MRKIQEIAQWVIDNRYPKSENEKVSDSEMYNTLIEAMIQVLGQTYSINELPISCVNGFEKPEYCSHRNNHVCQKCKDW